MIYIFFVYFECAISWLLVKNLKLILRNYLINMKVLLMFMVGMPLYVLEIFRDFLNRFNMASFNC